MPGLYDDDFVGFRIATNDERDTALREAVVAIDANVLLSLYRFRAQTARDLIKVLPSLGDRLVVPHQALREFWRHRRRAAASPQAATSTASDALAKSARAMKLALEAWARQVGLDAKERTNLIDQVECFATEMQDELAAVHKDGGANTAEGDPILEQLEQLLEGRVTSALDADEWERCLAEGHRRVEAEEPPGYRDAAKADGEMPEGAAGDYLVWYQAMRHAKEQGKDFSSSPLTRRRIGGGGSRMLSLAPARASARVSPADGSPPLFPSAA
jgi:predicted nucleic acid-binding protein